jgi:hypothetical protein
LEDLSYPSLVKAKLEFVKAKFSKPLKSGEVEGLAEALLRFSNPCDRERTKVSTHYQQNWVLEILLYLGGLNSVEDVVARFKPYFDATGHKLRPHAPYGGHATTMTFMLQGRDICEQWRSVGKNRTLTQDQFRALAWKCVAESVIQARDDRKMPLASDTVILTKYLQNRSMRIISSDLNGFEIMVDHYLSDICSFHFSDEDNEGGKPSGETISSVLEDRVCRSWQTDVVNALWSSRPLETWLEGASNNGKWLIKIQSSQDGNEGHKTKELAGRCRGIRLEWVGGQDPRQRDQWSFKKRSTQKLALVLDSDWSDIRKRNLYEAGWDWVGDVSDLPELRKRILQD